MKKFNASVDTPGPYKEHDIEMIVSRGVGIGAEGKDGAKGPVKVPPVNVHVGQISINVQSNQDPQRIARLVGTEFKRQALYPTMSPPRAGLRARRRLMAAVNGGADDELLEVLADLGAQEHRVLLVLARRLLAGQRVGGTDQRERPARPGPGGGGEAAGLAIYSLPIGVAGGGRGDGTIGGASRRPRRSTTTRGAGGTWSSSRCGGRIG